MTIHILEKWEHFFKPEVRKSGRALFMNGKITSSQPSDTEIQAFIKTSPPFKVSFKSESVESELITVDCTCPALKKGQFCKHIWATFLKSEDSHSDFLDGKNEIQKMSLMSEPQEKLELDQKNSPAAAQQKPPSQSLLDSQASYRTKQADYRKQQYQKQKQRQKDQKQATRKSKLKKAPEFPKEVEVALAYFNENGFPLEDSLNEESIRLVKKKLSRIFHPDIGGSHSEIVDLNKHFDVLMNFAQR